MTVIAVPKGAAQLNKVGTLTSAGPSGRLVGHAGRRPGNGIAARQRRLASHSALR